MKVILRTTAIAGAAALAATLSLGACGSYSSHAVSSPSASSSKPAPSRTAAPKPAAPSTTGPVGTTFEMTGQAQPNGGGGTTTWRVTVLKVVPNATPDNSFDAAPAGSYLVGAEIQFTGVTGTSGDDANNDLVVQGSDHQVYQPAFDGLAYGTNFDSGDWTVAPGQTQVGWVAFEVKNGVTPASIQFTIGAGLSGTVTWTVTP